MIDIKKLNEVAPLINLKKLCDESNLIYSTIGNKIRKFRMDKNKGELKVNEAYALTMGLKNLANLIRKKANSQPL